MVQGRGTGRRGLLLGGMALAGFLLPALVLVVVTSAPTDGTGSDLSSHGWSHDRLSVTSLSGPPSGLSVGDEVVAVDGVRLAERLPGRPLADLRPGDRGDYRVLRAAPGGPGTSGGSSGEFDVFVTLHSGSPVDVLIRLAPELPLFVVSAVLYAFVLWHRPGDPTARALYAMGVLLPLSQTLAPGGISVLDVARDRWWPYLLSDLCNLALWGVLLRVVAVFPSPPPVVLRHPVLLRWAHAVPPLLAVPMALAAAPYTDPVRRFHLVASLSVGAANTVPYLVAVLVTARYLTTRDPQTRRRMRWAMATLLVSVVAYLGLGQLPARIIGEPLVPWSWQALFLLPCPIALGAAVLRHRLFDIEVVLRRSLVYGGLTLALALVYLGTVTGLGQMLGTRGITPIVAAAAVTALFLPLRDRLRRTVSSLVFGNRDDPGEMLHRLGVQLEAAGSAADALPHLLATLTASLRLAYAAVELDADPELSAATGHRSGTAMTIPLTDRGEEVGRLVLDPGAGREPFGPRDRRLVEGLARQVTVIAQNQVLTHRLQRSLGRTVTALEEERRRLRRDVHDGLGPTLASAALRADLARRLVRTDPTRAEELLAGLAETQRLAIRDVRTLVEGLRPAALDQLGLVAALAEQAQRLGGKGHDGPDLHLVVEEDLHGLPAAVEVAAYRIAAEAMTNVVRHAGAAHCTVRLRRDGAAGLLVEVGDDGRGLGEGFRAGVGLTSMRERATELGGRLEAGGRPDGLPGMILRAWLPDPADAWRARWLSAPVPDRVDQARQIRPPDPRVPGGGASAMTEPEQRRDLVDDPEDGDPETVAGRERAPLGDPPLEVSEGDLADQRVEVPLDDDLDRE